MTDEIKESTKRVLNPQDLQSHAWRKLKEHMEAELQRLRRKNDSDLNEVATARVRGQIRALMNLLALADASPAVVADEQPDE